MAVQQALPSLPPPLSDPRCLLILLLPHPFLVGGNFLASLLPFLSLLIGFSSFIADSIGDCFTNCIYHIYHMAAGQDPQVAAVAAHYVQNLRPALFLHAVS
jgi:hypothetical protein